MTGRWGLALLALSVGLNLGLAVAVVQRRLDTPQPPPLTGIASPEAAIGSPSLPETTDAGEPAGRPPQAAESAPPAVGGAADDAQGADQRTTRPDDAPAPTAARAEPASPPQRAPQREPEAAQEPALPPEDLLGDAAPHAPPPGAPFGGPSPARLEEVARRLGVPPEDRPRFLALQRRFLLSTRGRRQELDLVRRSMKEQLLAPEPDAERLRALVERSAQLQAGLERALVEHVLEARRLLSGDAERRYLEMLAQLGPRMARPGPPRMRPDGAPHWRPRRRGGPPG